MFKFKQVQILVLGAIFIFLLGRYSSVISKLFPLSHLAYLSHPFISPSPGQSFNGGRLISTSSPSQPQLDLVKVIRVIDGDTIEITGGKRLRYIGMDTAELNKTGVIGCFAKEAYEKNKDLVEGKLVGLEKDTSETDKYGRLLRYVYLDGVMINEKLVKDGYAQVATYPPDIKYVEKFREAEKYARKNNLGLWKKCL